MRLAAVLALTLALTIDLIAPTELETNQLFEIDSCRLEFAAGGGFATIAFRYKVDASMDGKQYSGWTFRHEIAYSDPVEKW